MMAGDVGVDVDRRGLDSEEKHGGGFYTGL